MQFNWEDIINRTGTNAIAIDVMPIPGGVVKEGFSSIPMWVADMNFATAPSIPERMIERASHPLYGYSTLPKEYFEAIVGWHGERYGQDRLTSEDIGYENGVLGGVVSAMNVLCSKGDTILLHSPTYIGFTNSLTNAGYRLAHSPLVQDEEGVWRMDYEDMARQIKKYNIHAAIFCSPHNPTGRVWELEEIKRAFEVYREHDVFVVADEIWADLTLFDHQHIPTQTISEDARNRTIALYAPSKTFNLAGLVGSYHVVYNKYLRDRLLKESSLSHYNTPNILSVEALIGAYSETGAAWVDELKQVLSKNVRYAVDFIRDRFEGVNIQVPEGTYLLLIDCKNWCEAHGKSLDELQLRGVEYGVIWQDARPFHYSYGIRMNLALPYSQVVEAMERLDRYVFNGEW